MKRGICITALLLVGSPCLAQESDILTRLSNLEGDFKSAMKAHTDNHNAIMATQARMQGDIANLKDGQKEIKDQIAALTSAKSAAVQAPTTKQVWQPAVLGAWGQTVAPGKWVTVQVDAAAVEAQPVVTVAQPTVSFMSSAGACANGSCSTGMSGRRGLGLFRR